VVAVAVAVWACLVKAQTVLVVLLIQLRQLMMFRGEAVEVDLMVEQVQMVS
jgi:hypothetical protein